MKILIMIWKDYLYFSRAERNGIKVLVVILIIIAFLPFITGLIWPPREVEFEWLGHWYNHLAEHNQDESATFRPAARQAGSAKTGISPEKDVQTGTSGKREEREAVSLRPAPFNPNGLPAEAWEAMGLPTHVVRGIKNYEAAGGSFRYREDLQRIYLMQNAWYEELEAYIELPSVHAVSASGTAEREAGAVARASDAAEREAGTVARASGATERDKVPVNINRADTTELMQLRGIGAVFSRRIIDYREQLGGFLTTGQLLEVFGMDADRLMPIEQDILIDAGAIRKINVNEADYVTLVRHPYIDRQLANAIIAFRDQRGQLDSVAQLRASYLVTEDAYQRIEPYLMVGKP